MNKRMLHMLCFPLDLQDSTPTSKHIIYNWAIDVENIFIIIVVIIYSGSLRSIESIKENNLLTSHMQNKRDI